MLAQWVEVPDSVYIPDQLIVWFRPGVLNLNYLGCDGYYHPTAELPLTGDFILNPDILSYLKEIGATSIKKIFGNLNPCEDTVSLSRGGDLIRMPDFWNQLLVEFDGEKLQTDIPNLAIFLSVFFQNAIKFAEPNYVVRFEESKPLSPKICVTPNDYYFYFQSSIKKWDPDNGWFGIAVDSAWARTMGSHNIRVAVIDDGIDTFHPDFGSNSQVVVGGKSFLPSRKFDTLAWHGTRVAGIIAALTNNDTCIAGVAGGSGNSDNVSVIAMKIADSSPNNMGPGGIAQLDAAIVEASYAKSNGIPVQGAWASHLLNISALTTATEEIRAASAFAKSNDVLIVCAIGNGTDSVSYALPEYPAALDDDWILTVGGSTYRDRALGSRYGQSLDVLAPFASYSIGVDYTGGTRNIIQCPYVTGTSYSTPLVTGTAALLLSYLDTLKVQGQSTVHYLAPEDIIHLMAEGTKEKQTVPQTGYPLIKNSAMGYGIINAEETLRRLVSPFALKHFEIDYLVELSQGTIIDSVPIAFPGMNSKASDTLYQVIQYEILCQNVPFDTTYSGIKRAWIRGTKTRGFPDLRRIDQKIGSGVIIHNIKLPLYRNIHWAEVQSFSSTSANVRTYLYKVRKMGPGGPYEWLDNVSPDSIRFAFSVLDSSTITHVREPQSSLFSLSNAYPQPTQNNDAVQFHVSVSKRTILHYYVFDVLGRNIANAGNIEFPSGSENVLTVSTVGFHSGMYFIAYLTNDGQFHTRSFMVGR